MKFWIFIGRSTGMPYHVQKCDFQPTICPFTEGDWIEFVRAPATQRAACAHIFAVIDHCRDCGAYVGPQP